MDHRLLVARLVVAELVPVLQERLADTGDVAVAEDAEGAGEERVRLGPVARRALGGQEADDLLADGQVLCLLRRPPERRRGEVLDHACVSGRPAASIAARARVAMPSTSRP